MPRAPHADKVDLRRRDAAGELEAPRTGARPGDLARQGGNLVRERRVAQRRQVQAVAACVGAEIALPALVLGPVLASALERLASCWVALVTPPPRARFPPPRPP